MNKFNATIDETTVKKNKSLINEYTNREIHNHHKTALLDENYREIYNTDFKPQKNPYVTSTQSIHKKLDPKDPINPKK